MAVKVYLQYGQVKDLDITERTWQVPAGSGYISSVDVHKYIFCWQTLDC